MVALTARPKFLLALAVLLLGHEGGAAAGSEETAPSNITALLDCLQVSGIPPGSIVLRGAPEGTPDSARYEELNYQWSTLYGLITPAAYFHPQTSEEVAAGVKCCTRAGVRVVPRSGGHSYLKHSFGDENSLVIDLSRINGVQVEGVDVVRIGAGAHGGKIQADLWAAGEGEGHPFLVPTGMCPQVGIAGFTLGGGFGFYARHYGLATDNLLGVTLVDAEGTVRTVNQTTDPELFWALRGAGATSFGIVTHVTFAAHRAPKAVVVGDLGFEYKDFVHVFGAWQRWLGSSPPSHIGMWASFGGGHLGFQFFSIVEHDGQKEEDAEEELSNLFATWFPPPSAPPSIRTVPYADWMLEVARGYTTLPLETPSDLVNVTRLEPPRWVKIRSFFVDRLVDEGAIGRLEGLLAEMIAGGVGLVVEQYGGAIDRLGREETAFIHRRGVFYEAQFRVNSDHHEGVEGPPEGAVEAVAAMRKFFDGTKGAGVLGHTESYQNYLDEDLDDWLVRYYGAEGVEKLMEVKGRMDPGNVFYNPRSIPLPPTGSGSTRKQLLLSYNLVLFTTTSLIYLISK